MMWRRLFARRAGREPGELELDGEQLLTGYGEQRVALWDLPSAPIAGVDGPEVFVLARISPDPDRGGLFELVIPCYPDAYALLTEGVDCSRIQLRPTHERGRHDLVVTR